MFSLPTMAAFYFVAAFSYIRVFFHVWLLFFTSSMYICSLSMCGFYTAGVNYQSRLPKFIIPLFLSSSVGHSTHRYSIGRFISSFMVGRWFDESSPLGRSNCCNCFIALALVALAMYGVPYVFPHFLGNPLIASSCVGAPHSFPATAW